MAKTAVKDKKTAGKADDIGAKILAAREAGKQWAEITEKFGVGQGRAMLLSMQAAVAPKDRIKFSDDDELAVKVVDARNKQNLSWGQISARAGVGESKLKRLFEVASGNPALGTRIGKGGRYPNGVTPPEKAAKAPKAAKAEKAEKAVKAQKAKPGKEEPVKSAPVDESKPLADYTLDELKGRLQGKKMLVRRQGGGTYNVVVKRVKAVKAGEMTFSDKDGKQKNVLLTHIEKVAR